MKLPIAVAVILLGYAVNSSAQLWEKLTTPKLRVEQVHPPVFAFPLERVAIAPLKGGTPCAAVIQEAIAREFSVNAGLEVLTSERVASLLAATDASSTGYVNGEVARQVGRSVRNGALLFLTVERCEAGTEKLVEDKRTLRLQKIRTHIARTTATVRLTVQPIELSSGRIFGAVPIEATAVRETSSGECCPAPPPADGAIDEARRSAVTQTLRLFAGYKEARDVHFFADDECNLDDASALLLARQSAKAITAADESLAQCRKERAAQPELISRALYNAGVARSLSGDFEGAIRALEEAQRLADSGIVRGALEEARKARDEIAELSRQRGDIALAVTIPVAAAQATARPSVEREEPRRRSPSKRVTRPASSSNVRPAKPPATPATAARPTPPPASTQKSARLKRIEEMYQSGILTAAEYEAKKAAIEKE